MNFGTFLAADVTLRRVFDGVERTYRHEQCLPPDLALYQWTEGNFGCDCNRALFFARAAGEADPESGMCGDAERFKLRLVLLDGTVVYDELGK